MSRFLLNLRGAAEPAGPSTFGMSDFLRSSNLNFRMPDLGNMGESLDHGPGNDSDESPIAEEDTTPVEAGFLERSDSEAGPSVRPTPRSTI